MKPVQKGLSVILALLLTLGSAAMLPQAAAADSSATYTVTWIADGETLTTTVPEGGVIEKPADPQKAGYTFTGWTPEIPEAMPAHDLTFTAQFDKLAVASIRITRLPDKRTYTYLLDDDFDFTGMELEVTYADGSTEILTDMSRCTFTGYAFGIFARTMKVTVEYEGAQDTFEVTIKYLWWQWLTLIFLLGFLWY